MTIKQYSTIQRSIGIIEGILMGLDNERSVLGYDTLEVLDSTINELWEADNGGADT